MRSSSKVVFLSGGTGTPKLLKGRKNILNPEDITIIGNTGDDLTSDIPNLEVILIRRDNELLPSYEVLKDDDRIILFYQGNFDMKRTNRVVTELPYRSKKKKPKKKQKEKKIVTDLSEESGSTSPTTSDDLKLTVENKILEEN